MRRGQRGGMRDEEKPRRGVRDDGGLKIRGKRRLRGLQYKIRGKVRDQEDD
jgi:hypothetical protein